MLFRSPEEGRGGREKERERETPKGEQVSRLTSPPLTREGQREGEKMEMEVKAENGKPAKKERELIEKQNKAENQAQEKMEKKLEGFEA